MTEELKPEDDLAVPPRWYVVNRDGLATLCADEADARKVADECDLMFPRAAPHRAVLLGDVAAERERCAGVCEGIARQYRADGHGHSAERAANAIRLARATKTQGVLTCVASG